MPWERGKWVGPLPTIEELVEANGGVSLGCDCCMADGVPVGVFPMHSKAMKESAKLEGRPPVHVMCKLCASGHPGARFDYAHPDGADAVAIMQTICYVGNEILKAIREGKEAGR